MTPLSRFRQALAERFPVLRPLLHPGESATGLLVLSALVGALGAAGAIALRLAILGCSRLAFGPGDAEIHELARTLPWWRVMLAPTIGALVLGALVLRWAREASGHGVPELMRAVQLDRGVIRPRVAFVKALASAITIGSGGSAGREGPIAQIGAALGSWVGQAADVPPARLKVLVGAGTAAGIAATFNAPIAGAFFALEIVLGNFAMECFGPIVVASVTGTVLSRLVLGDSLAFDLKAAPHALVHPVELGIYALLGILAAFVAIGFTRALDHSEQLFERLPLPEWLKPAIGAIGVGALAAFTLPEVLGNGHDTVHMLLHLRPGGAEVSLSLLLFLLLGKLVATCLTLGTGGSGGVFYPSLYLGAVLGAAVGLFASWVSPVEIGAPGAYALVGMAAVAAGTTHAPITMMLIVFELTSDYGIIVPLMVAASVAALVSRSLHRDSIYTIKLRRKGIVLDLGLEGMIMHQLRVGEVMRRHEAETVAPTAPLQEVLERFLSVRVDQIYVVGEGNHYEGVILLQDVKEAIHQANHTGGLVIAADVARKHSLTLPLDAPLTTAMRAFQLDDLHEIPVVTQQDGPDVFEGTISEHDLLNAYNQEVLRKDLLLARFITRQRDEGRGERTQTDYFELPDGYGLAQIHVPATAAGRTLAELDLRGVHQLNVLAVKVRAPDGTWVKHMPDPAAVLRTNDLLVVMGPLEGIAAVAGSPATAR